jgi:hypothetical protein
MANFVSTFAGFLALSHALLYRRFNLVQVLVNIGALGRSRTDNLLIRSQMLYPLSYERVTVTNPTCRIGNALPVTPMAPSRCADTGGRRRRHSTWGRTVARVM